MEHPSFVGIDVSKAHLDVYVRPSGESFRVSHDDAGFDTLIARVRPFTTPTVVVLEATGGYEVTVAAALAGARLPVAVVTVARVQRLPSGPFSDRCCHR
jgi:transposase